ncbi:hypothetical protein BLA29_009820 [Euroglyphus maynei]|uniref:Glycoside hydrolase 35 catalytic domain-containing protein n=1 Tax=Euroglyphus maynei TaxID=6958 RepID=A0A1Y3B148_EURMA|nr:hypothetical protein BLA29_009820 [Euroglyphus maynei]
MYHGGTSFGFMNGAIGDWGKRFAPMVTSYDYDAPIGEYGQLRPLYFAIQKVIQKYFSNVPSIDYNNDAYNNIPDKFWIGQQQQQQQDKQFDNIKQQYNRWQNSEKSEKQKIINIQVDFLTDIFQLMGKNNSGSIQSIESVWPLTFEQLGLRHASD